MTAQFNVAEAKAKLSELIARALEGEEVVIARGGKPMVRLTRVAVKRRVPVFGQFRHWGPVADDAFDPEPEWADFADQSIEEDLLVPQPGEDPLPAMPAKPRAAE